MIVCDRHYKIDGSTVPAVETFYIGQPEGALEQFDLCASCAAASKEFIMQPPPKQKFEFKSVPGPTIEINSDLHAPATRGPGRPKSIEKEKK